MVAGAPCSGHGFKFAAGIGELHADLVVAAAAAGTAVFCEQPMGLSLAELGKRGVVELDNERRAAMVSNLLVVLCGDRATQPVVNAGTLY